MNDDDARHLACDGGRTHEIAAHRSRTLRRRIRRVLRVDSRIVLRNLLRPRVIGPQAFEHRGRGEAAHRVFRRAIEKFAPCDGAMHIAIEQLQYVGRKIARLLAFHWAQYPLVLTGSSPHAAASSSYER